MGVCMRFGTYCIVKEHAFVQACQCLIARIHKAWMQMKSSVKIYTSSLIGYISIDVCWSHFGICIRYQ